MGGGSWEVFNVFDWGYRISPVGRMRRGTEKGVSSNAHLSSFA